MTQAKTWQERRDDESTAFEFSSGPVGYRNGYDQGRADLMKDVEDIIQTLKMLRAESDLQPELEYELQKFEEAQK